MQIRSTIHDASLHRHTLRFPSHKIGHATFESELRDVDAGNIQFNYLRSCKVSPFFRLRV